MATPISRRALFRLRPADVLFLVRESRQGDGGESCQPKPWRPPGAVDSEDEFLSLCERCGKCSEACPHDVISHLGPAAGPAEATPIIDPIKNPCRWCTTMDCIRACPSGALRFDTNGGVDPIGKASLNLDTCLTGQGILCDTCAQVCPSTIEAIRMRNNRPELDVERCTGCGMCAYYCESDPVSITMQPEARKSHTETAE